MKILIDASPVTSSQRIGYYRYLSILLNGLCAADQENHYRVITRDPKLMQRISEFGNRFTTEKSPGRLPMLHREHAGFLGLLLRGMDLVHFPCGDIWFSPRGKKALVTLHDLASLHYPEYFFKNSEEEKKTRFLLEKIAALSNAILTISDYSRRDIISKLGVPPEKVFTIYNPVDSFFLEPPRSEPSPGFLRLGLESPYFLFVGNLDFRKNIPLLLRAFSLYRKRGGKFQLVLAGRTNPRNPIYYPPIQPVLDEMKERSEVRWFQDIGDDLLPEVYQRSSSLIFPSSFEGFGSPLIEAMASGTPIITVNTTCLPEVAGDAALIVPLGEDPVAEAMLRMERDKALRIQLVERGKKRLDKFFTPKVHGRQMKELYEKVAKHR